MRFCEEKKYSLDLDEDTLEVRDYSLSARALAAMRHFDSIELPPAFIHSVVNAPRAIGVKYLQCEAFKLSNTFPNNIALLSGNRVMYCIDFNECNVDTTLPTFTLEGFIFGHIEPAFRKPVSSSKIGLFQVSKLSCSQVTVVSAMDLQSKCFIFPRGADPQRPNPENDPLPKSFETLIRSYVLSRESEKDAFKSAFARESRNVAHTTDYWWVHSIVVPGRFPNFGQ